MVLIFIGRSTNSYKFINCGKKNPHSIEIKKYDNKMAILKIKKKQNI